MDNPNWRRKRDINGYTAPDTIEWSSLDPLDNPIEAGDIYEIVDKTVSGGGLLLDKANNETLCMTCHKYKSHFGDNIEGRITTSPMERRMNCNDCHTPHDPTNTNRFLLKPIINGITLDMAPSKNYVNDEQTGVCQVCHTQTLHWRNDGSDPIPHFTNGCPACHSHANETASWAHNKGARGPATICVNCHGHEPGTYFDPDATYPYTPGNMPSYGRGTVKPHSTHTESWTTTLPEEAGEDDKRGPAIYCSVCHDVDNVPTFKSGIDADGDGVINLEETDVCDSCHSPGGSY